MLKRTVLTLLTLSLVPLQTMAALQCGPGLMHVNVTGSVTTLNVSATKQVGQVCINMIRSANGHEVFNDCGALVGKVVESDPSTGASTLTHTAVFDLRDIFVTRNDKAQIYYPTNSDETGNPCAFYVEEFISEIESGTGIFRDGQISVRARGNVNFCPDQGVNTFTLEGEACVRR